MLRQSSLGTCDWDKSATNPACPTAADQIPGALIVDKDFPWRRLRCKKAARRWNGPCEAANLLESETGEKLSHAAPPPIQPRLPRSIRDPNMLPRSEAFTWNNSHMSFAQEPPGYVRRGFQTASPKK